MKRYLSLSLILATFGFAMNSFAAVGPVTKVVIGFSSGSFQIEQDAMTTPTPMLQTHFLGAASGNGTISVTAEDSAGQVAFSFNPSSFMVHILEPFQNGPSLFDSELNRCISLAAPIVADAGILNAHATFTLAFNAATGQTISISPRSNSVSLQLDGAAGEGLSCSN